MMGERKSRGDIYVGMKLEHKYRRVAPSAWNHYDWYATIIEIPEDSDQIYVEVTGVHGQSHPENWDKAHTISGLINRDYLEIPPK